MNIEIRELEPDDFERGFLETLAELAAVDLTPSAARAILETRRRAGVRTFVAVEGARVVGTTSLVVEQKFIHGGALCGHIEDVAVHAEFKKRQIGARLVRHATEAAAQAGCYKVILSCFERLIPFYEGCGYRRHDVGMRADINP
jgi:glucosamine-phosphate N-acetyltransferase